MICGPCKLPGFDRVDQLLAHQHTDCPKAGGGWAVVAQLRAEGFDEKADRKAREIMGIKGPEMPDHIKQQLREYKRLHYKEQYAAKKAKLEAHKRIRFAMANVRGR